MVGGQNQVLPLVLNEALLGLRVRAPQHEDLGRAVVGNFTDKAIGHGFPSMTCVRGRLSIFDGQHGVQQQHTLLGPARQVIALQI